jgi:sterol desaturase/sphingolipid hydroxylase (fatty acid hydroxylase superfamily)
MDWFTHIQGALWAFAGLPRTPQSAFYWAFVLSAVLLSAVVYVRRDCFGRPGLRGFLAYAFPPHIWSNPSSRVDRRFFVLNTLLGMTLLAPLVISSALVAFGVAGGLERAFGAPGPGFAPVLVAQLALALAVLLASDFGFFVSHVLCHRVPLLWEFHKVHHSAEVLTPVTAFRVHPLQQWLTKSLQGVGTGVVLGAFDYAFEYALTPTTILGANVFSFLFFAAGANLQHSHVWVSFGPHASKLFVSPAMHQVHHSRDPRHASRNLGGVFAFWDRLTGTHHVPRVLRRLRFGLTGEDAHAYRAVWRLYLVPFHRCAKRFARFVSSERRLKMRVDRRLAALSVAVVAVFAFGTDVRAGGGGPSAGMSAGKTQGAIANSKRAARFNARLPHGATQHGIVQVGGQPQSTAKPDPVPAEDTSCSCWNGIGSCRVSGKTCEPAGGELACTGTCADEDPGTTIPETRTSR